MRGRRGCSDSSVCVGGGVVTVVCSDNSVCGRRGSDSDSSVCVGGGVVIVTVVCAWEEG